MSSLLKKNPKRVLIIINGLAFCFLIGVAEMGLRWMGPFHVATVGHEFSDNARKYGWGFAPGEPLKVRDPDTGEVFISLANNHGWRDKDRHFENPENAYRILVLGDSVSYGAVVPADKIYSRVLEDRLRSKGYNVEVITLAYGMWSTDQELEALIHEGVKYAPDLVIVQFTTNDINGNAFFREIAKEESCKRRASAKPFNYELDDQGALQRRVNPCFRKPANSSDGLLLSLVKRSEILKRVYGLYVYHKLKEQVEPPPTHESIPDASSYVYRLQSKKRLIQLRLTAGVEKHSPLYTFLVERLGKRMPYNELNRIIDAGDYSEDDKKAIFRILEERWFQNAWSPKRYTPKRVDPESYEWKLYFALIDNAHEHANAISADLAIFNSYEEGRYAFERAWHKVGEDEENRANLLSHREVMASVMRERGIAFIKNQTPYERARNDPHPNIEGNRAMADDIYAYLMKYKRAELKK